MHVAMRENIRKGRILLVISDTLLVVSKEGIKGYEPVVRELDIIANLFDEIIWLGYRFTQKKAPVITPLSSNIRMVPMPPSGGKGYLTKIKIILLYPVYLFYILKYLPKATHVHSRAPSHPALLALIISKWDKKRTYWHKYAGNWIEPNPPKAYGRQRQILTGINKPKVYGTVNGYWPGQKKHLLSFENPCLYETERQKAEQFSKSKNFDDKLSIIFVGSLSGFKGVVELVEAMKLLKQPKRFNELIIVGDGELMEYLRILSNKKTNVKIKLAGFLNRLQIEELYNKSHIIALPSKSEGFPKVIAEGAAYGCIPLVTNISSLDQYIKPGINGFLLKDNGPNTIAHILDEITIRPDLKKISETATEVGSRFTYEYYRERIVKEIL
jgi:glycosyltransferase involved in cell wall biosynthesis